MTQYSDTIIEELAQRRFMLESLLEEQSAVIRKEPGGYQAVYKRNLHGYATKPGDQWIPVDAADKDKNRKRMEEMCARTPTCIDDRMRIVFAAHGLLMYLIRLDMNELPMSIQLQIGRRTLELHRKVLPLPEPAQVASYELALKKGRDLLTRPFSHSLTRAVNEHDIKAFKDNLFRLVGMSFMLQDGDEEVFYEVVEIGLSKEAMWYQIQFQDCADYVQMDRDVVLDVVNGNFMCIT